MSHSLKIPISTNNLSIIFFLIFYIISIIYSAQTGSFSITATKPNPRRRTSFKMYYQGKNINFNFNQLTPYNIFQLENKTFEHTQNYKEIPFDFKGQVAKAYEANDHFEFYLDEQISIPLKFYTFENSKAALMPSISFVKKYESEDECFVCQLQKSGYINKRIFSVRKENNFNSTITFGEDKANNLKKSKLTINQNGFKSNNLWEFKLSALVFNYKDKRMMFDNKSSAAFGLGLDYIFAPKKFFDFLTQKIFKEFLDSGKCKLMNYTYYRLIYCNKMDMNALPKVTFSISDGQGNSNEMTLHLKDFFEDDYFVDFFDYSINMLRIVEHRDYLDKWVFGYFFLNHFDFVFDYDNNLVDLYYQIGTVEKKSGLEIGRAHV